MYCARAAHALFLFLLSTLEIPLRLRLAGKVGWESPCPLGKVLTYKDLIYLLNFPFYCINTSYLMDRCRITTHWKEGSQRGNSLELQTYIKQVDPEMVRNHNTSNPTYLPPPPPPPPLIFSKVQYWLDRSTKGPKGLRVLN